MGQQAAYHSGLAISLQARKGMDVHELEVMKHDTAKRAIIIPLIPAVRLRDQWLMDVVDVSLGGYCRRALSLFCVPHLRH
jgi:hypothetical protein